MYLSVYEPEHLDGLLNDMREFERKSVESLPNGCEDIKKWAEIINKQAIMVTMMTDNDKPAAVFVGIKINKTTIEIWAFTGNEIDKNKTGFMKCCVVAFRTLLETVEGLTRIQALVIDGHDQSVAWLKRFGFGCDTPSGMRNFGDNDETYFMYSLMVGG